MRNNPIEVQAAGSHIQGGLALHDSTPPVHTARFLERRFHAQRGERLFALRIVGVVAALWSVGFLSLIWTAALVGVALLGLPTRREVRRTMSELTRARAWEADRALAAADPELALEIQN